MKTEYARANPFITADGSVIRELMHPNLHGNVAQSLAEATIPVCERTRLHRHLRTEELYHVTAGSGWMTLGEAGFRVTVGDTVLIAPGTPHCIENNGPSELRMLCCCAPAYSNGDTDVLELKESS